MKNELITVGLFVLGFIIGRISKDSNKPDNDNTGRSNNW